MGSQGLSFNSLCPGKPLTTSLLLCFVFILKLPYSIASSDLSKLNIKMQMTRDKREKTRNNYRIRQLLKYFLASCFFVRWLYFAFFRFLLIKNKIYFSFVNVFVS